LTELDLERIERKLDMIIRHFNIDGKAKLPVSIKQEAHERVIKILDRRNRRKKEKGI
jgi:hypothetical protein